MRSTLIRSAILPTLVVALAALPCRGHAQAAPGAHGFFIGAGVGIGGVTSPQADASHISPSLHLRAGWAFSRSLSLALEGTSYAYGSARVDSAVSESPSPYHPYVKLHTQSLLVSLQAGPRDVLYVRPGIGFAQHAFGTLRTDGDAVGEETSHEWGPAAGIAVGREVRLIPGFPLNVEASALYSRGEDSTSPRWSGGLQVVRDIHF
ncbi:MAG TPA: hypothetical protein VF771_19855 [Longimicrobiaceae bacterium]